MNPMQPEKRSRSLGLSDIRLRWKKGRYLLWVITEYESMDSRTFGVVGESQIKGRILLQIGMFYIRTVE